APATVAPRQVPARPRRQRFRHEIEARTAPRMAAQQPCQGHPSAGPEAVTLQCLVAVIGAGRQMAAMESDQRRERVAVHANQRAAAGARRTRERCPNPLCLNHPNRFPRWNFRARENRKTITSLIASSLPDMTKWHEAYSLLPNRTRPESHCV